MSVKVQFNPSTLKALFNPATQKVQIVKTGAYGMDCGRCPTPSQTPAQVEVTFSGITDCPGCVWIGPDLFYDWFQWSMLVNLNQTWLVNQQIDPCEWLGRIANAILAERWHAEPPGWVCDYMFGSEDFDAIVHLRRWFTSSYLRIVYVPQGQDYWPGAPHVFDSGHFTHSTTHCFKTYSISNTLTCGAGGGPPKGGTADVVEL